MINRVFSAYIKLDVKDKHGVLSNITSIFSSNRVSIKRLIQDQPNKLSSSIVIITHNCKNDLLTKSLKSWKKSIYYWKTEINKNGK